MISISVAVQRAILFLLNWLVANSLCYGIEQYPCRSFMGVELDVRDKISMDVAIDENRIEFLKVMLPAAVNKACDQGFIITEIS